MRALFSLTQLYRQTDKNATRGTAKLDFLQECELMKCLQFLWCRGVKHCALSDYIGL